MPPLSICNLHFLRKALEEKKEINIYANVNKDAQVKEVTIIDIPKYEELSVKNIWPFVKAADDDLCEYFPDYSDKQIPDRDFMFSILWTFRYSVNEKMVEDACKNRTLANKENEEQSVYIQNDLFNEIANVLVQKNKYLYLILKQLRETLLFYLKSLQSFQ